MVINLDQLVERKLLFFPFLVAIVCRMCYISGVDAERNQRL
jgi:hypothetical protein